MQQINLVTFFSVLHLAKKLASFYLYKFYWSIWRSIITNKLFRGSTRNTQSVTIIINNASLQCVKITKK